MVKLNNYEKLTFVLGLIQIITELLVGFGLLFRLIDYISPIIVLH